MTDGPLDNDTSRQLELDFSNESSTHIYVASALTALDPEERQAVSNRCELIEKTIMETSGSLGESWEVHLPVVWSAPGPEDTRTPREIYEFNRDHVRRASGLVVLADQGGSLGAGQEFAWAIARRMPVLLIGSGKVPLSRQIMGTPARMCTRVASTDEELQDVVSQWVADWRSAVEGHHRMGAGERVIASRAVDQFTDALVGSIASFEEVAALAGLSPDRASELFSPEGLLDGSVSELISLAGALGLEAGEALNPTPIPELSPSQKDGLATAAQEYDWTANQILQVESRARLELVRDGIRRLSLTSVQDWITFARNLSLI